MYQPPAFKIEDFAQIAAIIEENSFATLVTFDGLAPFATHLPLLFEREKGRFGTLAGHVARGNAQWKHLEQGGEALAIFQGPHAYISPSWYETELAVPTWNYVAVHAYGVARLLSNAELEGQLRAMIDKFESSFPIPWPGNLPDDFQAKLRAGIVGFELEIKRLEGKRKLSQNRSITDQNGVIAALQASDLHDDQEVAALMKNTRKSGAA